MSRRRDTAMTVARYVEFSSAAGHDDWYVIAVSEVTTLAEINEICAWVAQHGRGAWTAYMDAEDAELLLFFADHIDAIHAKLRWVG